MPIFGNKLVSIPEPPQVERKKKKAPKHINKNEIGNPLNMQHWISVRPSQDEDLGSATSPNQIKKTLNVIKCEFSRKNTRLVGIN